jgi:protein gp37
MRFLSIEPLLEDIGAINLSGIDWVIVGGESGPGARPMKDGWARSVRDQCFEHQVPFFFKQWGGVRKKVNGRVLDGKTYDQYPARSQSEVLGNEDRIAAANQIRSEYIAPSIMSAD